MSLALDSKMLWRDWRGGQLNLIVSALVLAVMVVTAVSLLADRVERGLDEQISAFLAADMALQGNKPVADQFADKASQLELEQARIALFSSMVFAGDASHLAALKVVDNAYPLRGLMQVSKHLDASAVEIKPHGPPAGEAWVEARLLNLLNVELGDSIEVGYLQLPITRIISNEPDRGTGFSLTGARVMMNLADLEATQLIRPGSRVTWRLLLAGAASNLTAYQAWYDQAAQADEELQVHFRLRKAEESEEQLSEALQRGRSFLLLSGTIGVLLAGLAMALASQRYALRLTDQVALMKAWGQSARSIRRSQIVRLLILTTVASLSGLLLGWLAHYALLSVAAGLFDAELPIASARPWLVATATGFAAMFGFALPALWHLPSVAPLKVLRRDLPSTLMSQGRRLSIGIGALWLLAWWYSQSLLVASLFLGILFALFAVASLVALQVLKLVQRFGSWRGSFVRLGLANLWRRRGQTLIQLVGFSVTLMLLLVTIGMRTNLIAEWQAQLPDDAPTHFLLNVSTQELPQVKAVLEQQQVEAKQWYPMVRGRLSSINGEVLSTERKNQSDGLAREVNFTQADVLPDENKIVAGRWWPQLFADQPQQAGKHYFSIEQDVAGEIGLKVGDVVDFSIGGLPLTAELASIRTVNWQNMQANFYIIFSPGALDGFTPNWLSSVRTEFEPDANSLYHQQAPFVKELIAKYPTALVLELSGIVERIRDVIDRVTLGLEMILLLVLACGGLVLFAAIGVSFDERLRENAVLRTLGSPVKVIAGALTVEFAVLGAIAGLTAAGGAELVLYLVQTQVFNLDPAWHWNLWILGIGIGVIAITVLGLLRSREILSVPPLRSLRQIEST